jgi:hypothetical protein
MSSAIVTAHGGTKNFVSADKGGALMLGGIVSQTTTGVPMDVHMKGLDRLISQTTGVPREEPIMEGVISSTVPMHMKDTPEYHPVPKHEQGKTHPKRMGQVPYGGPKY